MVAAVAQQPVKERPILFSRPMVRAILDGRKTQTRRVVKGVHFDPRWGTAVGLSGAWRYGSPHGLGLSDHGDAWFLTMDDDVVRRMCTEEAYGWGAGAGCPYGIPGDRLWVKETWQVATGLQHGDLGAAVRFRADNEMLPTIMPADKAMPLGLTWDRWRPSIYMPRWASRITLEVTGVRVERLQDISEEDAKAEGLTRLPSVDGSLTWWGAAGSAYLSPRRAFEALWESINGPGSWGANPWLWAISFRRL